MSGFQQLLMASMVCTTCVAASTTTQADAPNDPSHEDDPSQDLFPSPTRPLRLEALGGVAFGNTILRTGESLNAYGPGLGLRAGYSFQFGGTIGLRYDHFLGSTSTYPLPLVALVEYQTGASFLAADIGFEFRPNHAIFRPHLGIGMLGLRQSVQCSPVPGTFEHLANELCLDHESSETSWKPAAAPGLLMGLGWRRTYGFVDVQYILRSNANAFTLAGGFGLTL